MQSQFDLPAYIDKCFKQTDTQIKTTLDQDTNAILNRYRNAYDYEQKDLANDIYALFKRIITYSKLVSNILHECHSCLRLGKIVKNVNESLECIFEFLQIEMSNKKDYCYSIIKSMKQKELNEICQRCKKFLLIQSIEETKVLLGVGQFHDPFNLYSFGESEFTANRQDEDKEYKTKFTEIWQNKKNIEEKLYNMQIQFQKREYGFNFSTAEMLRFQQTIKEQLKQKKTGLKITNNSSKDFEESIKKLVFIIYEKLMNFRRSNLHHDLSTQTEEKADQQIKNYEIEIENLNKKLRASVKQMNIKEKQITELREKLIQQTKVNQIHSLQKNSTQGILKSMIGQQVQLEQKLNNSLFQVQRFTKKCEILEKQNVEYLTKNKELTNTVQNLMKLSLSHRSNKNKNGGSEEQLEIEAVSNHDDEKVDNNVSETNFSFKISHLAKKQRRLDESRPSILQNKQMIDGIQVNHAHVDLDLEALQSDYNNEFDSSVEAENEKENTESNVNSIWSGKNKAKQKSSKKKGNTHNDASKKDDKRKNSINQNQLRKKALKSFKRLQKQSSIIDSKLLKQSSLGASVQRHSTKLPKAKHENSIEIKKQSELKQSVKDRKSSIRRSSSFSNRDKKQAQAAQEQGEKLKMKKSLSLFPKEKEGQQQYLKPKGSLLNSTQEKFRSIVAGPNYQSLEKTSTRLYVVPQTGYKSRSHHNYQYNETLRSLYKLKMPDLNISFSEFKTTMEKFMESELIENVVKKQNGERSNCIEEEDSNVKPNFTPKRTFGSRINYFQQKLNKTVNLPPRDPNLMNKLNFTNLQENLKKYSPYLSVNEGERIEESKRYKSKEGRQGKEPSSKPKMSELFISEETAFYLENNRVNLNEIKAILEKEENKYINRLLVTLAQIHAVSYPVYESIKQSLLFPFSTTKLNVISPQIVKSQSGNCNQSIKESIAQITLLHRRCKRSTDNKAICKHLIDFHEDLKEFL